MNSVEIFKKIDLCVVAAIGICALKTALLDALKKLGNDEAINRSLVKFGPGLKNQNFARR